MEALMQSLIILIFSFLFICILYAYHFHFNSNNPKETSGALKRFPLIGSLPGLIKNQNRLITWTAEILSSAPTNTITLHYPGKPPLVMTANPSNVEHILNINFIDFPKGDKLTAILRDVFGYTMFALDGDLWMDQRKSQTHMFTSKSTRINAMDTIEQKTHGTLIPILERAVAMNHILDLQEIFDHFMFDCICKIAFGADPDALSSERSEVTGLVQAFHHAESIVQRCRYYFPLTWKIMKRLNIGHERTLRESISMLHKYMEKIIRPRLAHPGESNCGFFLPLFNDGGYSMEQLRDLCISVVFAGKDTIKSALTWFFWLLSSNPRVEKSILEELEAVRARHNKGSDETYNVGELREMHYLHAALTESMRLYPPVPIGATRTCKADNVLPDGTFVKKGWCITYNAYAMGSMDKIWGEDCLEYKPERWLVNGVFTQKSQYQYPIFHGGPRICLGKDLAYNEMKLIAASVMERFVIEAQNKGKCPEFDKLLTLTMKGGLPVKVRERCPQSKK